MLKSQKFLTTRIGKISEIPGIVNHIRETGRVKISPQTYQSIRNKLNDQISAYFSKVTISEVFRSHSNEFEDAHFHMTTEMKPSIVMNGSLPSLSARAFLKYHFQNDEITLDMPNYQDAPFQGRFTTWALHTVFKEIVQKSCLDFFILSAERFGISLFYKELDFTRNRVVEELRLLSETRAFNPIEYLERVSARYALPISDNIDFTRDLPETQRNMGSFSGDNIRPIEKMMMGYYKIKNNEIRFISRRRKENRFDIPLHLASSSARGLSDLYFYLKHVAEPGQILIIDEPESHLSPTNQVLMARLLVFCVNSGLKVLITTHSDYIVKEINNLIMLNGDFEGKEDFLNRHRKNYTEKDRLNPDSVKVYTCENGGLSSCAIDKKGIDMPVFDEAIDSINLISNHLASLIATDDFRDD